MFLRTLLGPLLKTDLLLIKNILIYKLAKSALIPLETTVLASASDALIQKNFWISHPFLERCKAKCSANLKQRSWFWFSFKHWFIDKRC